MAPVYDALAGQKLARNLPTTPQHVPPQCPATNSQRKSGAAAVSRGLGLLGFAQPASSLTSECRRSRTRRSRSSSSSSIPKTTVRIRAAREVFDRVLGRSTQRHEHSGYIGLGLNMDAVRAKLDAFTERGAEQLRSEARGS
jgi:hypothetical protein